MLQLLKTNRKPVLIIISLAGIAAGYIYYRTIGCSSGSCPITSSPYLSMIWGGLIGYLLGDMITGKKKNTSPPTEQE